MSKTVDQAPILLADSSRGYYAIHHAAVTLHNACTNDSGWTCSDVDSLSYAAQDAEQAMEVETELTRATYTDAQGMAYTLELFDGGDVFLMPS